MVFGVFDWDAMLDDDNNVYDSCEIVAIKDNYEAGLISVYDVLDLCEKFNINVY
jgi:hypothetical protein